jgi:hypothetical protein
MQTVPRNRHMLRASAVREGFNNPRGFLVQIQFGALYQRVEKSARSPRARAVRGGFNDPQGFPVQIRFEER